MKLVKANTLESKADVIQRCVFRIVWVTIPGAAIAFAASLFGHRQLLSVFFLSFIIAIPLFGVVVDAVRLKIKNHRSTEEK